MKLSSRRKAIAITAGLALVVGSSPAFGVDDERSMGEIIAQLVPGEDNVIPNKIDLYLGTNYSVTEKDDGKVLYRWGQAVKRPTDIRFARTCRCRRNGRTPTGKGFQVTKAELVLKHAVTNNPNDQIRPEDWENEGATGLLPEYTVSRRQVGLDQELLRGRRRLHPRWHRAARPDARHPAAPSSDLVGGFSNAWYTTIDRDPFEWTYKTADGAWWAATPRTARSGAGVRPALADAEQQVRPGHPQPRDPRDRM